MNSAGDDRAESARPEAVVAADEWILGEAPESLADLINHVLDRGVVTQGEITISVAGVDLVYLGLNALLTSVSTARRTLGERTGLPPAGANAAVMGEGVPTSVHDTEQPKQPMLPAAPKLSEPAQPPAREPLTAQIVELTSGLPARLEIDPDGVQRDLARLVLTLVELLRRVVEHQAVRRMEDTDLNAAQIERMGVALQLLEEKLQEIKAVFGLADHELNIDLGPLGKLL